MFWVRILFRIRIFLLVVNMLYFLLSGYSPALRPEYDDRSTIMWVMVVVICILILTAIVFLFLWLANRRHKDGISKLDKSNIDLTKCELKLLTEYRELDNKEIK